MNKCKSHFVLGLVIVEYIVFGDTLLDAISDTPYTIYIYLITFKT